MNIDRKFAIAAALALAAASCAAQQKFPLKPGEWEVSTALPGAREPIVLRVCLNDELWTRALSPNENCSVENLSVNAKGVSYSMDCPKATVDMKGTVVITFDGKEHMTGRSTVNATSNGQTTQTLMSTAEYRWKAPACNNNDVNMKQN